MKHAGGRLVADDSILQCCMHVRAALQRQVSPVTEIQTLAIGVVKPKAPLTPFQGSEATFHTLQGIRHNHIDELYLLTNDIQLRAKARSEGIRWLGPWELRPKSPSAIYERCCLQFDPQAHSQVQDGLGAIVC